MACLADGHRVYFAMPEAPFGAMAEQTLVDPRRTISLPDTLDDVAAAALANPGMSCFAALVERARFQIGETVLINGATGAAGVVAVQVAKQLGAGRVIVTGRNAQELEARVLSAPMLSFPSIFAPRTRRALSTLNKHLRTHLPTGLTSSSITSGVPVRAPLSSRSPKRLRTHTLFASSRSGKPAANLSNYPPLHCAPRPYKSWAVASNPFRCPNSWKASARPSI